MKKYEAVIIDDEIQNLELLKHFLEKYCSSLVKVVGISTEKQNAINLINNLKPAILFLDIRLNNCDSFDILDEIEKYNYKVIFVTGFDKYAVKAFKYNAIDYILKPIKIEEIILAVNKVCEEIKRNQYTNEEQVSLLSQNIHNEMNRGKYVAISTFDRIEFVKTKDIVYCHSEGRYTIFYLYDGSNLIASRNLGEYESILNSNFFRIHNRYIINLDYVVGIHKSGGNYCEMILGNSLPIAKRRKEKLYCFLQLK